MLGLEDLGLVWGGNSVGCESCVVGWEVSCNT